MKLAASTFSYPAAPGQRAEWILSRRGPKAEMDVSRPYAFLHEKERGPDGTILDTSTIFLTNKECPWRCLMCDLWKNTTDDAVEAGVIPAQIEHALPRLPQARQVKLYNSGSFFDPQAIPRDDWTAIAKLVAGFERVIVECHPALVSERCGEFAQMLDGKLEVAMGLETANPDVLEKLNKRMTLGMFENAAASLRCMGIDLRVFVLVKPPFMDDLEALISAKRSIDFAMQCGATVVCLIPTRTGNGAMDELARQELFVEPSLDLVEAAADYGVGLASSRVFTDLWDLRRFSKCNSCFTAREERLHRMNLEQRVLPHVSCNCGPMRTSRAN